jgi:hypothetical protein
LNKISICLTLALVIGMMTTIDSRAVTRSGNDLLTDCRNLVSTVSIEDVAKDKVLGMGYCIGLIDGFVSFNYIYETVLATDGDRAAVQMCLPERISTRQLAKEIVHYLEQHPERMAESGQALAAQALISRYPCEEEKSR